MPLFEVAVIEHTKKKESEGGSTERLVFGPYPVVAKDPQGAALASVLKEGRETLADLDPSKLEVLVRPFAG